MANWNNQNFTDMVEEDDQSRGLRNLDEELTEYEELTALICAYWVPFMCKEPSRTSTHTGHKWVQDILATRGSRFQKMFRVERSVFYGLCHKLVQHGLRHTMNVGVQEMVAMFLLTVGHGVSNRMVQELFQHSGETVSRQLHTVLNACISLSRENIKPCDPQFRECHPKIRNDPRYYPHFQGAIGAIDGTHIKCVITGPNRGNYIGRYRYPTQNVMAVCDWDMCFTFVLAGWQGSAHDARIFEYAVSESSITFPHPPTGKYYLVDSAYPTPLGYLGPYRRGRQPGLTKANKTFNMYHSSLRSTIERTFGVWKNRFQLLKKMRPYSYETQVKIVCATMAIHNFIRRNSDKDSHFQQAEAGNTGDVEDNYRVDEEPPATKFGSLSTSQMNQYRDSIRQQIDQNVYLN